VRQNAFQFPSGDAGGSQQPSQGLNDDSVAKLLSVLAKGQSKLATPSWPKFGDNYCSYYIFREELEAYVQDYVHGVSDRTLAQQIKQHCLSKGTADYVEFATSPKEILETLGGLFARPSKLIDCLMDPVKKAKKVQYDDWPMLLSYLSKVRSMFQEIRRLNVLNLFSNINNVDAVLEKLPNAEVEKWLEYSSGLMDNQLATALENFVTERWTYATTLVSRTTSADQALKSMGIGVGGSSGGQQGGARPGSPKNNNKNNKKSWWEAKKKADGNGGTSQVPVAATQPSVGGGGQNAQPCQIAAVGAYNQIGSGANGQNNQNNQNNQSGGRQVAIQSQQGGQSGHGGHGGRGGQQPRPFQCRVQGCRDNNWHNWGDCLIFRSMTLPQRLAMVAQSNTCEFCLKHGKQVPCWVVQKPGGAPPCGENGCVEIHHPLLHEQRG
jgi:hypothetical protein